MSKFSDEALSKTIVPFLTAFAARRTETGAIPGFYSAAHDMWVADGANGLVPIISSSRDLAELTTKTKVNQESDDDEITSLLEITTKTDSNNEGDDQVKHAGAFLDISTKTEAQLERDDTDPRSSGMW